MLGNVSLWDKITRIKHAIVEPRNPALFPSKVREYQSKIGEKNSHGCILFAVCRGKVTVLLPTGFWWTLE